MSTHTTMRTHQWWASISVIAALFIGIGEVSIDAQAQEHIDSHQEALIVSAPPVSPQTQQDLGLITVWSPAGSCSGTLLNRSWVLTAYHCVTSDAKPYGPAVPASSLTITAAWTMRTATPTAQYQLVGDVALLYLGHADLGAANTQVIYNVPIQPTHTLTTFGRGISELAYITSDGIPVPSFKDGLYRSFEYQPSSVDADFITMPDGEPHVAGGDSGGPDFVTRTDGRLLGIAGVSSTCLTDYLPGMPGFDPLNPDSPSWTWVTNVTNCKSATLAGNKPVIDYIMRTEPGQKVSNDFNDDNLPDIVWHNESTGEVRIWFMEYSSRIGHATVRDEWDERISVAAPWRIVATRDFDGDAQSDILWYHEGTGWLQIWYMNGSRIRNRLGVVEENLVPTAGGNNGWHVVGANDMNNDGHTDIIWHNEWSGMTQIWEMWRNRIVYRRMVHSETLSVMTVGYPWSIVATDDMNRDGKADIVWHNDATGETQIWHMDSWQIKGRKTVDWEYPGGAALVGWPWRIAGTNDFDRDGIGDIVWHNASSGQTQIWYMTTAGAIKALATVDAWQDGLDDLALDPWGIVPH